MQSCKKKTMNMQRKQTCCSSCGRPSHGHVGPCGRRCDMEPDEPTWSFTGRSREPHLLPRPQPQPEFDLESGHSSVSSSSAAILELANQVGKLSVNMDSMQRDLAALKVKDADGARTLSMLALVIGNEDSTKSTSDAFECLTSGAKVNTKVLKAARNGEFVNLTDFAPILEPTNVTEASVIEGELVFKSKRQIKTLDSFLMWSLAWRGYEEFLIDCDPSLYKQLVAYCVFIQTTAAKCHWQAVYAYDIRNRAKK